ncbi:MAG: ABC transporter transmembrane domain-containing protein [Bacteroidota bacterium]|nr:ABC transporter transmembrane domain-containing protein [Bacteroidota bacterium]
MKTYFRIVRLIKPYMGYALLNALFNILSVIFNLFSLTMVAPFLDLLFLKTDQDYADRIAKGVPAVKFSVDSLVDNFYYYFTSIIVDPGKGKLYALITICVLVVVMFFFKNLTRYIAMFFLAPVRNGVVKDLRNSMHRKIMDLPLAYYSDERKGDIMSRMTTDAQEIEWSVMSSLEATFREPLTILLFLSTMIYISPQLTLFVFVLLPLTALLITRIGKSLKRTSVKSKERLGSLLSIIEETLSGLRIIKAFNAEQPIQKKFEELNSRYTDTMNRMYRKTDLASPMSEFLGACVLVVVMYFGGKLVLAEDQSLTAAMFIAYIAIFSQMIPPSKAFTNAFYNIQKGIASADRINKILDAENTIIDKSGAQTISDFNAAVSYENVSFSYRRGDTGKVLNAINLVLEKGKTIALVGQSGSGKTTLADMLPRFYDPTEGDIRIDGISLRDLRLASIRSLIGVVSQESILFNDTVANNIAFGMTGVNQQAIENAAKIANAHDFILQMPEQYLTNIGDRGGKMSGGQRQRLSIARAVLKNPPILILDEATSALDTESERLVQDALHKLMANRTTLVIAHRLSTIQHANEIIVMNKGVIEERGTHNELIERRGLYKKLFDLQSFS